MTPVSASELPAGNWAVDVGHSEVAFEVEHNELQNFRGRFGEYSAELSTDDSGLAIEGSVAADSVQIGLEKLREVVLGDEFLDVASYPEITFRSSSVEIGADGSLEVKGTLGLKGNSGEVTARGRVTGPVTDLHEHPRIAVGLEATIDRTDWGLEWQANLPSGEEVLGDEVRLIVYLELAQPEG